MKRFLSADYYDIVLAEDDNKARVKYEKCLRKKGFGIRASVKDGKELYEVFRESIRFWWWNPERLVVLSDTDMPEMYGDMACKKLLEKHEKLKKMIIIGMSDNPDNEKCWENVGVWQTFILKRKYSGDARSKRNIAEKVYDALYFVYSNPHWFKLDEVEYIDGNKVMRDWGYRRSIRDRI